MTISILIADDQPLIRQALSIAVNRVFPGAKVLEAGTLAAACKAAEQADDIDLILLDLFMPGAVGYSGIALLHAEHPEVPIVVISSAEGSSVHQDVRSFGAVDFIRKDSSLDMIETIISRAMSPDGSEASPPGKAEPIGEIRTTVAGLTPTQLKVLLAVLEGKLNKQIAYSLGMSEATVRAHMTVVMRKLHVSNRTQAALVARSLGLDMPR